MNQETLLKEAIGAMTSEARGVHGLAAGAIARGKQIRRRRRLTALSVVAVLAFAGWGTAASLRPRADTGSQTAGAAAWEIPAPSRTVQGLDGAALPGNWAMVAAAPSQSVLRTDGKTLLIAATGDETSASGRFVMRAEPADGEYRLIVTETGGVPRTVQVPGGESFRWSPMSDTIVATVSNMEGAKGFATIDAATGNVSTHLPVAIPGSFCGPCTFSWYPGGSEVVIRQAEDFTDAGGQYTGRGSTFLFSAASGSLVRTLPMQVNVDGPASWSPDGKLALSYSSLGSQLIDVEGRRLVRQLPGQAWFASNDLILLLRNNNGREVVALRPDGTVIEVVAVDPSAAPPGRDYVLVPPRR